jgi:hypothetical protein
MIKIHHETEIESLTSWDSESLAVLRYVYDSIASACGSCELIVSEEKEKAGHFWISETMKDKVTDDDLLLLKESVNEFCAIRRIGFLRKGVLWSAIKQTSNKNKGLSAEVTFLHRINTDPSYRDRVSQSLGLNEGCKVISAEKVTKTNGYPLQHTELWNQLKMGTKESSPTSKADVCLLISDGYRIYLSLKFQEGRITSADCFETNAILMSVYEGAWSSHELLGEILKTLCASLKSLGKHRTVQGYNYTTLLENRPQLSEDPEFTDTYEWLERFFKVKDEANALWSEVCDTWSSFSRDVIRECLSGSLKFGGVGVSQRLCILNQDHEVEKMITIPSEEFDTYLTEFLAIHSQKRKEGKDTPFAMKSSGPTLWIRMF